MHGVFIEWGCVWGCVWGGNGAGGEEQILGEWQGCTKILIKFGEFYRKFLLTGEGGKGKVLSVKTSCTIYKKCAGFSSQQGCCILY